MPGWYSSLLSSLYHTSNALVNNNNNTQEQEVVKAEEEADQAAKLGHPGTQSQLNDKQYMIDDTIEHNTQCK